MSIHDTPTIPIPAQKVFLSQVARALPPQCQALSFVAGDWNFCLEGEGPHHLSGRLAPTKPDIVRHAAQLFATHAEVMQEMPTHRVVQDNVLVS
eukprot:6662048-Pyramimonas_sp.AAC.1